ncbi:MAG: tetratricopeptide repeat protein [Magnetospirillum sp. WYHS-4]
MTTSDQALTAAGIEYHRAGRLREAEAVYRRVLGASPRHPDAQHLLGVALLQQGRTEEALQHLRTAVLLDGGNALYHANLAEGLRRAGKPGEAEASARRALALDGRNVGALNCLGAACQAQGKLDEAAGHYRKALKLDPNGVEILNNLGGLLRQTGRAGEAEKVLGKALKLAPGQPDIRFNLALAQLILGKGRESEEHLRAVLAVRPDHAEAWNALGNALLRRSVWAEAIPALVRAAELAPGNAAFHQALGVAYQEAGKTDEAAAAYEKALAAKDGDLTVLPAVTLALGRIAKTQGDVDRACRLFAALAGTDRNDAARLHRATALPAILQSETEIDAVRARLDADLDALLDTRLKIDDPFADALGPLFYLAYHGRDDRPFQEKLARLYRQACPSLSYTARKMGGGGGKRLKVGFVSRHFHSHTIGKLYRGFVAELPRDRFEVTTFLFARPDDPVRAFIRERSDRTVALPETLADARRVLEAERLDVLFYTDIGMDPFTYFLAFARLAPVQCTTWGHPVTTGLDTMDYFLSSPAIDPAGNEAHFTETLVRLRDFTTYYYRPEPETWPDRAALGLPEDERLYACLQTLFKFHPSFDSVMGDILRADSKGRILLIESSPVWRAMLEGRFARTLPDVRDRIVFLRRMPIRDFMGVAASADVLLDTPHFCGGNSTLETVWAGAPAVTLPSAFTRGRLSSAIYEQMRVGDLVARDEADYVAKVVGLGVDPDRNRAMRARILERRDALFENRRIVEDLAAFMEGAAGKA